MCGCGAPFHYAILCAPHHLTCAISCLHLYVSYANICGFVKSRGSVEPKVCVCCIPKAIIQIVHTSRGSLSHSFANSYGVVIKHQKGGDWKDISYLKCFGVDDNSICGLIGFMSSCWTVLQIRCPAGIPIHDDHQDYRLVRLEDLKTKVIPKIIHLS